jgi:alpha-D-xyloside xylohydrolase
MNRYNRATIILALLLQVAYTLAYAQVTQPAPGVQKVSLGTPDKFTPYAFCEERPMHAAMRNLPAGQVPFNVKDIKISINDRGVVVEIPLEGNEQLYGFGLQFGSLNQKALKVRPIVNDNPLNNLGIPMLQQHFMFRIKVMGF